MPIYNETFAETWDKVDRINAAKKLLRENGYEVIDKLDQIQAGSRRAGATILTTMNLKFPQK